MRHEEVEMQQLKRGDQIAVMGNAADLSPLLLAFMGHIDYSHYHQWHSTKMGQSTTFTEKAKKMPNPKSATSESFSEETMKMAEKAVIRASS